MKFQAISSSKNIIVTKERVTLSAQDIIIEVITKDFFRAIPTKAIQLKIFHELLEIITTTDKTVTARQARRALKRISFDAVLLVKQLEFKAQPTKSVRFFVFLLENNLPY